MEHCKVKNMYDLTQTLAAPLLETVDYPWEALPKIGEFIKEIGPKLDPEVFERRGENIWIAKSVSIAATATLNGPLIIDEDTEVRPGAFIRGNVIVGKNCVVGNSTELKMLFCLMLFRYHIIIMLEIPYLVSIHIWGLVPLPLMSRVIRHLW